MARELTYRCDASGCKTTKPQLQMFPFLLRMRTDEGRARTKVFCSFPCLQGYVGTPVANPD